MKYTTMELRFPTQIPLIPCIILTLLMKCLVADRQLTVTYNEKCTIPACTEPQDDNFVNLVHVTGKGANDTIHFLWSSIGAPTVLVARTTHKAELVINWRDLIPDTKAGSISFKPKDAVLHSSALMFTRLLEFNDTDDDGVIKSDDARNSTLLEELKWQNANVTINETGHSAVLNSSVGVLGESGTFSLHLTAFGDSGRPTRLPHLQYMENSTQFDLTIQNMTSHFLNSRFALEIVVVGRENETLNPVEIHEDTTIDDEYTPGVFSILDLKLPDTPKGSYLQWKPVSYTLTKRAMENARHVYKYNLDTDQEYVPHTSIAHAAFSPEMMSQVGALNLSFGITKDGFYKQTNYTSWSATVGYGDPPEEFMTLTVYIVISAGLGIPMLIVVFGGAGVCISKHRQKKRRLMEVN